jgi:hypothetical protein
MLQGLSCRRSTFRKRVRRVINEEKWRCGGIHKKSSQVKSSEVKSSEFWGGCEVYVGVVKWNEGKTMVIRECNVSWHYAFHYCYCLVYRMLNFSLIIIFTNWIRFEFIVCSVSLIVWVVLWGVFCLSEVSYFVWYVFFMFCLIVVPLPLGKPSFAIQLNMTDNTTTETIPHNT